MKSIMDQRVKSCYILWIFLPRTQPVFIFCCDLNKNFVKLAQKQSVLASCEGDTTVEYGRRKTVNKPPCSIYNLFIICYRSTREKVEPVGVEMV